MNPVQLILIHNLFKDVFMNPVQLIPSPATLDLENMTFLNSLSFNFLNVDICVFDYIYKCVTALDTNMIK
jgi:hypothetical protein